MASIMPWLIGALVALCIALPACGDVDGALHAPLQRREGAGGIARAVGGVLCALGVRSRADAMLLEEVRQLSVGRVQPFKDADGQVALGALALMCASAALVGGIVALSPIGMVIGCAALLVLLVVRAVRRRARAAAELEEAMPEAFGSLAVALGSGHSLPQAMRYVGSHAREPIRSEFMRVSFAVSCGVAAPEALDAMLSRLHAPGLELVVLALKVSQRTGAPLKDLLAEASAMVSERIKLRRQLDVKTSQARMSAHLVAAMPIAMAAVLALLSSDYREGMTTAIGAISIMAALLLNGVALIIIRKIMDVAL